MSKDKKSVKELSEKGQLIEKPKDALKDPYILEFVGLPENKTYSETQLEQKLIDKLEHFLLEEGKGYFLVDGYKLPPIMFTPEEAKSLVAIKNILNYHTEDSLNKNFNSALLKIKAVLPTSEKDKLEFLDSRTAFHEPWAPKSSHLEQIQKSISENLKLKISYHSKRKDEITVRTISPYALYFSGAVWTTIGYCELRKEIREFRLDRINSLVELAETFSSDRTFNLNTYLEERLKKIF